MKLSIIIVSYNTSSLLEKCLTSVFDALSYDNLSKPSEVIVVDNASKDDSVHMVRKKFPRVRIIINKENAGFAKANNQAIALSKGEYVLFLNSDTEVSKQTFQTLLDTIEKDKALGVLGCRLNNPDGSLQPSAGYFPHLGRIFLWMFFLDDVPCLSTFFKPYHATANNFYKSQQIVDWVTGACMLVRRSCLSDAGVFDEAVFMYGEEVEWCYRIKKNGWKIRYIPDTSVIHIKGASSKQYYDAGIVEEFQFIFYFFKKHKPSWQYPLMKLLLRLGVMLRMWVFAIIPDKTNTSDKKNKTNKSSLYAKALEVV